jgi:flagellin-like protein
MKLKNLTDDDAVSPVIGVILMVAITVILAAVIGTFVLGLGDQVSDSAPQASFDFNFANNTQVEITHDGGDSISDSSLAVKLNGTNVYDGDGSTGPTGNIVTSFSGSPNLCNVASGGSAASKFNIGPANDGWGGDVTAGSTLTLNAGAGNCVDSDLRVVWSSSSGGDTATLGQATWTA